MRAAEKQAINQALHSAYGFLLGELKRRFQSAAAIPGSTREMHDGLCRGLSAILCATGARLGASGCCGACGRYTVDYFTERTVPVCECGSSDAWLEVAFAPPKAKVRWSISLDRADRRQEAAHA